MAIEKLIKPILFVLLGILAMVFAIVWDRDLRRRRGLLVPTVWQTAIGLVTNFFDFLGIGSFATTTSLYRFRKTVRDEQIPGTLNVGHCLPTVAQAYISISEIGVEPWTLLLLIVASVLGAWLGAGVVIRFSRSAIQRGMGLALLVAAGFLLAKALKVNPEAAGTLGLAGWKLAVALVGSFVFGALMMIGVGAYAPIMIMVSLLGMNPKSAYPIMMGACAFLMPTASTRFVRAGTYDPRAALGLAIGGIPGVLLAFWLVSELDLTTMYWLVLFVVLYTSISMLLAAKREKLAIPQPMAVTSDGP